MLRLALACCLVLATVGSGRAADAKLLAGVAKVEVTKKDALPAHDPLFVKALVLKSAATTAVLVTVDAVAVGEIGPIGNGYLPAVRARLQKELGIAPNNVIVNASHCHGIVCADVDAKTVEAVTAAHKNLVPVTVGVGVGHEARVSENRRIRLKNGEETDVRHAYSMPPDAEVAAVGPIDPQVGVLRLDRPDGKPLAVVYTFACHPIMGVPNGGNTADLVGFASAVVEAGLGDGALALFVQGCGGDVNPVGYKEVHVPRDAEPLGHRLGLTTLKTARAIRTADAPTLAVLHETLRLPRADHAERILALEAEQARLVASLKGTTLNLRTFLELAVKYNLSAEFPSHYAPRYLHEAMTGKEDLAALDAANRRDVKAYVENVLVMEKITRVRTNLALLKKHQERNLAAGRKPVDADLTGLRVGDFVLVTFPGELTVEIGLAVKKASPHKHTFVAGYTNGYLYYTPTAKQLRNPGAAQEDSDSLVAPEWERAFHERVAAMLKRL